MLNLLRPIRGLLAAGTATFYPCCCGPKGGPSGGSSFSGSSDPTPAGSSGSSSSGGPAAEDDGPDRGSGSGGLAFCPGFIAGEGPSVIRVDVEGVEDLQCADCNLLNGSYYCEFQVGIFPGRLCTWALAFEALCNDEYSNIELVLRESATVAGQYVWTLLLDGKAVIASEVLSIEGTILAADGDRMTIEEIDGLVLDESPTDALNVECRFAASPRATLYPVT